MPMSKFSLFRLALITLVSGAIAGPVLANELAVFSGKQGKIDIAGGTAHIPVMKEAAKQISRKNPDIRFSIAAGGSGVGVQKVGEGIVDIGNTGRPLSNEEVAKYGLKSYPFALDGVAIALNPNNPVRNLTADQVKNIFSGKIKNWSELGGRSAPIHLYSRDEASGTREVFWEKLLNKGSISTSANIVASNGAMKSALTGDVDSIGYLSIGYLDKQVSVPVLDGIAPTQENAESGKYPIVRKLYMNTKGEPQGLTADFIHYVLGPEGQKITTAAGYIPLR